MNNEAAALMNNEELPWPIQIRPTNWCLAGSPNGICSSMCVGNGFIRSERWMNIRGSLDGNGFLFQPFSIQCAPHKTLPTGMHKCIPYAKSGALPLDEPGFLSERPECINAFPTKDPCKFQFTGPLLSGGCQGLPSHHIEPPHHNLTA